MNKLKEIRKGKGLTQDDIVKASGVCSKGYLSDVENGNIEPSVTKAIAIAKALKTTVEKVWGKQ